MFYISFIFGIILTFWKCIIYISSCLSKINILMTRLIFKWCEFLYAQLYTTNSKDCTVYTFIANEVVSVVCLCYLQ